MKNRTDYALAVLAASDGASLTPVQVQKLFFLLDKKADKLVGGPYYGFFAYDYGPFDAGVYGDLRTLAARGEVEIETETHGSLRKYRPTTAGLQRGRDLLNNLSPAAAAYVRELSTWVRGQSFASLVTAVYNMYPEMKVNSVFRG